MDDTVTTLGARTPAKFGRYRTDDPNIRIWAWKVLYERWPLPKRKERSLHRAISHVVDEMFETDVLGEKLS